MCQFDIPNNAYRNFRYKNLRILAIFDTYKWRTKFNRFSAQNVVIIASLLNYRSLRWCTLLDWAERYIKWRQLCLGCNINGKRFLLTNIYLHFSVSMSVIHVTLQIKFVPYSSSMTQRTYMVCWGSSKVRRHVITHSKNNVNVSMI